MTKNQIDYWNFVENKRHNQAMELYSSGTLNETKRSNLAREEETQRSNLARESETKRSNLANELLGTSRLQEDVRHNQTSEKETSRSNIAREFETNRSNVANEIETHRSNVAREVETNRHNRADEEIRNDQNIINREHYLRMDEETHRSNLANEKIRSAEAQVKLRDVQTKQAYNTGSLALGYANLAENVRRSQVSEANEQYRLNELQRANLANEAIGRANASASQANASASLQNAYANAQNAQTNAINAETRQQELQHSINKWENGERGLVESQTERTWEQATSEANSREVDIYNAETGRMNAETAKGNAITQAGVGAAQVIRDIMSGIFQPIGGSWK